TPVVIMTLYSHVCQRTRSANEALCFRMTDKSKDEDTCETYYAELAMGDAEIGLAHIPSNDDPEFQKWVSTPLGAGVVAYVPARDVDALHERAKKAGFLVESPP